MHGSCGSECKGLQGTLCLHRSGSHRDKAKTKACSYQRVFCLKQSSCIKLFICRMSKSSHPRAQMEAACRSPKASQHCPVLQSSTSWVFIQPQNSKSADAGPLSIATRSPWMSSSCFCPFWHQFPATITPAIWPTAPLLEGEMHCRNAVKCTGILLLLGEWH